MQHHAPSLSHLGRVGGGGRGQTVKVRVKNFEVICACPETAQTLNTEAVLSTKVKEVTELWKL